MFEKCCSFFFGLFNQALKKAVVMVIHEEERRYLSSILFLTELTYRCTLPAAINARKHGAPIAADNLSISGPNDQGGAGCLAARVDEGLYDSGDGPTTRFA